MTQTNIIQIKEQKHYFIIWLKLYSNLFFLISQKCLSFCLVLALAFMKSKLFLRSYSQAGWVDKNITTFFMKVINFFVTYYSSSSFIYTWLQGLRVWVLGVLFFVCSYLPYQTCYLYKAFTFKSSTSFL